MLLFFAGISISESTLGRKSQLLITPGSSVVVFSCRGNFVLFKRSSLLAVGHRDDMELSRNLTEA